MLIKLLVKLLDSRYSKSHQPQQYTEYDIRPMIYQCRSTKYITLWHASLAKIGTINIHHPMITNSELWPWHLNMISY